MAESQPRKVLIAMDGSESANYALNFYKENLRKSDDCVIILHCRDFVNMVHSATFATGPMVVESNIEAALQEEATKEKEMLTYLEEKMTSAQVTGQIISVQGRPGEVIVKTADDEHVAMIVVGSRGLGMIRRTLLGSVSDYILHHSHVPVVVCRHKDHHKVH